MEVQELRSQCLNLINDQMEVVEYGEGFMVWVPLHYSDDDAVCLHVRPEYDGWVVSDEGSTMLRFHAEGVATEGAAFRELWSRLARPGNGYTPEVMDANVIAAWGSPQQVASRIMQVTQACLRAEGLVGIGQPREKHDFTKRVVTRVEKARAPFGHQVEVQTLAPIRLRSGRERRVTAVVRDLETRQEVAIQALGGASKDSRERSFDRCYSTFGPAEMPMSSRLAVVGGRVEAWDEPLLQDLRDVSTVVFFEDDRALEAALRSAFSDARLTS